MTFKISVSKLKNTKMSRAGSKPTLIPQSLMLWPPDHKTLQFVRGQFGWKSCSRIQHYYGKLSVSSHRIFTYFPKMNITLNWILFITILFNNEYKISDRKRKLVHKIFHNEENGRRLQSLNSEREKGEGRIIIVSSHFFPLNIFIIHPLSNVVWSG